MQKLDFVDAVKKIAEDLKTYQLLEYLESQVEVKEAYYDAMPLLVLSIKAHDRLLLTDKYEKILDGLNSNSIYNENNLSTLLFAVSKSSFLKDNVVRKFFHFHETVLALVNVATNALVDTDLLESTESQLTDGIVILRVINKGEGLDAEVYASIFRTIKDLVNTVQKINGEFESEVEVILVDSGSDTNVAIRATAETAKSLFLIFKEMWDFITNYRHYRQKQKNQSLTETLSVLATIKENVDKGVITSEQGQEYSYLVKSKTDKLIGLKVLPKSLVSDPSTDYSLLLGQARETRLLNPGDTDNKQ